MFGRKTKRNMSDGNLNQPQNNYGQSNSERGRSRERRGGGRNFFDRIRSKSPERRSTKKRWCNASEDSNRYSGGSLSGAAEGIRIRQFSEGVGNDEETFYYTQQDYYSAPQRYASSERLRDYQTGDINRAPSADYFSALQYRPFQQLTRPLVRTRFVSNPEIFPVKSNPMDGHYFERSPSPLNENNQRKNFSYIAAFKVMAT